MGYHATGRNLIDLSVGFTRVLLSWLGRTAVANNIPQHIWSSARCDFRIRQPAFGYAEKIGGVWIGGLHENGAEERVGDQLRWVALIRCGFVSGNTSGSFLITSFSL